MGFWHTGYMEFHEPSGEEWLVAHEPAPPTFPCTHCGISFLTESDLRLHLFAGHSTVRPRLVYRGRECGRSRLAVTTETWPDDWVITNARNISVNSRSMPADQASDFLASQRDGVSVVVLDNGAVPQTFEFEFALADEEDLQGVDDALQRLIEGGELSPRTVHDFIERSKRHRTAKRYLEGLASYFYGVLARENASDHVDRQGVGYEGKYDRAVSMLGAFDRPPAEAICGIVAFHYNQFTRAMAKTKSQRVANVSLRFQAMTGGSEWEVNALSSLEHSSLDHALSDSLIDSVLAWSAVALDGSAIQEVQELEAALNSQRREDQFKLSLVAAEHYLARGDHTTAAKHAENLRHTRHAETWYTGLRRRLQGAPRQ